MRVDVPVKGKPGEERHDTGRAPAGQVMDAAVIWVVVGDANFAIHMAKSARADAAANKLLSEES